jgi:hypothetical protein
MPRTRKTETIMIPIAPTPKIENVPIFPLFDCNTQIAS